jgi:hypothetical protein
MKEVPISKPIITVSHQAVTYRETLKLGDHKVKIIIKRDSYISQSYARILIFNNLKWNTLHTIPGRAMKSQKVIRYCSDEFMDKDIASNSKALAGFSEDIAELKRLAEELLS